MYHNPHGPSCPWYDFTEKFGAPNLSWCEEILCQWITNPANTWSNLGYLISSGLVIYFSFKRNENWKLKIFGPIIFIMGIMSMIYHLSNFYLSQVLDFVGMFLFTGWVIGINLIRIQKLQSKKFLLFILIKTILLTLVVHFMYQIGLKFQILIIGATIGIIWTEYLAQKKNKTSLIWFFTSLFLLFIAIIFSFVDLNRIWCDPTSHGWFSQGHALWHWFSGLAMYCIYLHYYKIKIQN